MPQAELDQIDMLLKEGTPEAAHQLRALEETTPHKETRKAARRALYRLSQAGVTPPPTSPAATEAPMQAVRAFASAYDGAGNRLLFLLLPDPDGGSPTMAQTLINDIEGIKDFQSARIPRRELQERLDRFDAQLDQGVAVAEVEGDYGRWLIAQGRALNQQKSRLTPRGLLAFLPRIGEPQQAYTPPIYTHISPKEIREDSTLDRDPADLFKITWFDAWFFDVQDTVSWLPEWAAVEAEADLTEEEREQRFESIITQATVALMTPEMRRHYILRLEENADVLWRRGKEQEAKQALVHALALQEDTDVAEIPFAREIVKRTLGAAMEIIRANREQQARG